MHHAAAGQAHLNPKAVAGASARTTPRQPERWLGRSLEDDETHSLNVYSPHPAPTGPEREALRQQVLSQARQIGSRAPELSDEEVDSLVQEALAEIRRNPA